MRGPTVFNAEDSSLSPDLHSPRLNRVKVYFSIQLVMQSPRPMISVFANKYIIFAMSCKDMKCF